MIERRNFYRLFHTQPDASFEVIKEGYRVLMQNHPASSDNHDSWNANLLHTAYKTLQDPHLRAAYDRELLKRYPIKTLSQGMLGIHSDDTYQQTSSRHHYRNRRNYYRILQVQPDAPDIMITACHRILKQNSRQDMALLDEAYCILSDPSARTRYDAFLINRSSPVTRKQTATTINLPTVIAKATIQKALNVYQSLAVKHCLFCHTPYVPQADSYPTESCLECKSPLQTLPHCNFVSSHRAISRIPTGGRFSFHLLWPSKPHQGVFQDSSPAGIRFIADVIVNPKDIIKIDAPNFQAIAEVTHANHIADKASIGTRFLTVKFDRQYGNFVTAQA